MTTLSYPVNTSTNAASAWKKYQAIPRAAIRFKVEEIGRTKKMTDAEFLPTLREVLAAVLVDRTGGAASVAEANSKKTYPRTANPTDTMWPILHMAHRFGATFKALEIQRRNGDVALLKQLALGAMGSATAMAQHIGDYRYAPSTAVLALTDTDLTGATTTLTLKSGLGQSWITDGTYITNLLQAGSAPDRIAVLNAGVLVTNATGYILSKSASTPSITVVWDGTAPSNTTDNLQIVKANTIDNAVNDYNLGMSANYVDLLTASTMGGLATATKENWAPSGFDTSGGRLTWVRISKALDTISNNAPEPATHLDIAQGVLRDIHQNYEGQMRFESGKTVTLNGNIDVGLELFTSRRVPPGTAMIHDNKQWQLFYGEPEEALNQEDGGMGSFSDLYMPPDDFIMLGDLNWMGNFVHRSWRSVYGFRSLQEQ